MQTAYPTCQNHTINKNNGTITESTLEEKKLKVILQGNQLSETPVKVEEIICRGEGTCENQVCKTDKGAYFLFRYHNHYVNPMSVTTKK